MRIDRPFLLEICGWHGTLPLWREVSPRLPSPLARLLREDEIHPGTRVELATKALAKRDPALLGRWVWEAVRALPGGYAELSWVALSLRAVEAREACRAARAAAEAAIQADPAARGQELVALADANARAVTRNTAAGHLAVPLGEYLAGVTAPRREGLALLAVHGDAWAEATVAAVSAWGLADADEHACHAERYLRRGDAYALEHAVSSVASRLGGPVSCHALAARHMAERRAEQERLARRLAGMFAEQGPSEARRRPR